MTLREAIKGKCLECSCGDRNEVKNCLIPSCALYPFRLGKNPFRAKRELTEEQRQVCRDRFEKARVNKSAKTN